MKKKEICVELRVSPLLDSGLPRSLEAAVQRYGQATFKASCATQMEPANGKPGITLTYGKLYSRSLKIAFSLLHKVITVLRDRPILTVAND